MGTYYQLVNLTKAQVLRFAGISGMKKIEICANPVSASIVAWYMLSNLGDRITFVPDDWLLEDIPGWGQTKDFHDVTESVIAELVAAEVLEDNGRIQLDKDDPEICSRNLENLWSCLKNR